MDRTERLEAGKLGDRAHLALEQNGQHQDVERRGLAESRVDLNVVGRHARQQDRLLLQRALADQAFAGTEAIRDVLALLVGVARGQAQRLVRLVGDEEGAVARSDERRQFAHDQARYRLERLLTLHHGAELGQIALQPILLAILLRGLTEIGDHLVDALFERQHFALGFDGDRPGQVALGHRGAHLGDRADLAGEVVGELIHVVGQIAPSAGSAGDLGLAA